MRVSTNQIFQSGLSAMQSAQSKFNKTGLQLATGRRILTPADDPGGATQAVQFKAAIKNTEQYQRNADYAKPRLEYEEAQLVAVTNLLQRARELVVASNNDTYNPENRKIIASEIRQLRSDILGLANSREANGEYLFAGTRSQHQPFVVGDDGRVTYVGAEGPGAVREVDISSNRRIATGDTGAHVFMNIPERSGLLTEAVLAPGNSLNGVVGVDLKTEVADLQQSLNSAGKTFRIRFEDDGNGNLVYKVLDPDGNAVKDQNGALIGGPYVANQPIEFAGRRVTLTLPNTVPATLPSPNDEILSRPITQVDLFKTLDDIARVLEMPATQDTTRETLSRATSMALRNLDAGLGRLNEVRTSVGLRLSVIDTQTELNDERLVDLNSTLSDIQDLDYAEAISRFQLQQTVLQAARQTYAQTSRLSLFDFL
ncbi:flagellar hook-associated protein FlgL [Thermochromatium tepidum]|uniref:Flagellar hook-associated protein 3 n=1 Tax=Thermochromatium tepidum ATCC 43061 TaxID=316276 RepID=A0A6I6E8K2_THETI|nr:flagellar hook-associated protein FlgL [Thermochromatium tepidum]QGU32993.1 flagellar hook-associated protein 3 [Thermochromatium tepidum ATCC 43061]